MKSLSSAFFISLVLYASCATTSPARRIFTERENTTLTSKPTYRCVPAQPDLALPRLKVADCQAAITAFEHDYPDFSYTLVHEKPPPDPATEISCPYHKTIGGCTLVISFSAKQKRRTEITNYIGLAARMLARVCVADERFDGGQALLHERVTGIWLMHPEMVPGAESLRGGLYELDGPNLTGTERGQTPASSRLEAGGLDGNPVHLDESTS